MVKPWKYLIQIQVFSRISNTRKNPGIYTWTFKMNKLHQEKVVLNDTYFQRNSSCLDNEIINGHFDLFWKDKEERVCEPDWSNKQTYGHVFCTREALFSHKMAYEWYYTLPQVEEKSISSPISCWLQLIRISHCPPLSVCDTSGPGGLGLAFAANLY